MRKSSESFAGLPLQANGFLRRQNRSLSRNKNKNRGMTLLELLIVVSLLGIVALASVSLIVDTGEYKQQEVTEDKWLSIKRAIVGDDIVDITGHRDYAGFATDMGRLPNCLRELIRPYDCEAVLPDDQNDSDRKLRIYSQDVDSNQWSGWRGPYLAIPGANEYRDGWGNIGLEYEKDNVNSKSNNEINYGWLFGTGAANGTLCEEAVVTQQQPGAVIIQSCGDGGKVGNTTSDVFFDDYPYVTLDIDGNPIYIPTATRHDYQVDMGAGWNEVPVKFKSTKVSQSRIIPADSMRLRMNYPVTDGSVPDWTDILIDDAVKRDAAPFLSSVFPAAAKRLVDATGKVYTGTDSNSDGLTEIGAATADVTVPIGTTLTGTLLTIPNGATSTLVFSDNSELDLQNCPCEAEVNAGTLASTVLNGATTIAIKPDNIAPITADLGKYLIELPQATIVNSATSVTLPNGATLTFSAAVEDSYFPKLVSAVPSTVTVSEGFDVEGDLVKTDSGDQFLIPPTSTVVGSEIAVAKTAPTIPKGLRSITVVCESDGLLFDGNCSDAYSPIAMPYKLNVSPRSYIPRPDEIIWNIQ